MIRRRFLQLLAGTAAAPVLAKIPIQPAAAPPVAGNISTVNPKLITIHNLPDWMPDVLAFQQQQMDILNTRIDAINLQAWPKPEDTINS